ncbi:MAG: hypothetical protein RLZZ393_21 [Pseudomonadota bacterium]|jgi:NAD(P)H dehydrogenase (quinone)
MKILVTGAGGQFGRRAAEQLLERIPAGDLILTTRSPAKLADLAARGVSVRAANFDDPASLDGAFAGAERMLLVSTDQVGARIESHCNAVDAAKRVGVKHMVYTSIVAAADPANPSLVKVDHLATEHHIRASGLSWNFLEDSQYAEAVGIAMAKFAMRTGQHTTSAGEGRVGFVSREDCVDCAVALLLGAGTPNTTYTPTGPERLSQRDAMNLVAELSGKPIETRIVSTDEMQAIFDAMGVARTVADLTPASPIPWVSEDMLSFDQALKAGVFDIVTDHVQQLTGHPPRSLREVLIATRAEWDPR